MKHLTKRTNWVTMLLASLIYIPYVLNGPTENFNNIYLLGVIVLWGLVLFINKNSLNITENLINLMVLSIPISFVSIRGSYESLVFVNWFIIFNVALLLLLLIKVIKHLKNIQFNWTTVLLALSVLGLTISHFVNINRGVASNTNTLIMTVMFIITVALALLYWQVEPIEKKTLSKLMDYFKFIIVFLSLTVFLQYFLFQKGIVIGRIKHYKNIRLALGSINFDFSFLSLLLVSNIFVIIQDMLNKHIKKVFGVLLILIQFGASFLTSARTGPVAALVVLMVALMYYVIVINVFKLSVIKRIVLTVLIFAIEFAGFYFIYSKRGFGASQRDFIYKETIDMIVAHPIVGQGLGWVSSYKINPHNFFLQTFVEGGLLFALPLISAFVLYFVKLFKKNQFILLDIFTVFVGAMFIPDIMKSRFLVVLFLFGVMSMGIKELSND